MESGNFGKVREAYVSARQSFPQEVIDYCWQFVSGKAPLVLDLGCGTGIATRQLADRLDASIIGCDVDQKMIETARERPVLNIRYVTAPAAHLPFSDETFDAVMAFSAFHWFTDDESFAEIRRVLKEHGWFLVINKNDTSGFRKGYKKKLARLLGKELLNPKDDYNPIAILKKTGFVNVTKKSFSSLETFSLDDALLHIQSAAAWSEVPVEKEQEALALMRGHVTETAVNGQAVRELEVVVVSGKKK